MNGPMLIDIALFTILAATGVAIARCCPASSA
jgi:hypothetical protein